MTTFKSSIERTVNEAESFQLSAASAREIDVNCVDSQNSILTTNTLSQKNQHDVDLICNKSSSVKGDILNKKKSFTEAKISPFSKISEFNYVHDKNPNLLKNEQFDNIDSSKELDESPLPYSLECFDEERKCDSGEKLASHFSYSKNISNKPSDVNSANGKHLYKETASDNVYNYEQNTSSGMHMYSPLRKTDNDQPNQMKTKLRSMWNNMKYGWRVKREVNLKVDSAAWLLGRCYHNKLNDGSTLPQDVSKQLKLDIFSKIWLTYRINFPLISGTDFISDSGWGCMLRCGQMMMAQALICHFLQRDWRITPDQPKETRKLYKMILRWFGDSLSDASPFSLHQLVTLGERYGRKAGNWYGPTHAAQILRDALDYSQKHHKQLQDVRMYVALDGIVFKQDIDDLCRGLPKTKVQSATTDKKETIKSTECEFLGGNEENLSLCRTNLLSSDIEKEFTDNFEDLCPSYTEFGPPSFNTAQNCWKSLILFVSVRLGNDKINPFYIPCIKNLFTYENCIGIIGGRPKHALYFIGWQDDKIIHMDPHTCQPAVDVEREDFNEKTFHSASIRTMSFSEMDPSCAIGFYFRREAEFQHFVENFSEIVSPLKRNLDYPVFALAEGRRADVEEIDSPYLYTRSNIFNRSSTPSKDEDDGYILL